MPVMFIYSAIVAIAGLVLITTGAPGVGVGFIIIGVGWSVAAMINDIRNDK